MHLHPFLINIRQFGYYYSTGQISSPCKGNPCEPNEICLVNKDCLPGIDCKPYICQPGCKLGEVSQYMVSFHSYDVKNPENCTVF